MVDIHLSLVNALKVEYLVQCIYSYKNFALLCLPASQPAELLLLLNKDFKYLFLCCFEEGFPLHYGLTFYPPLVSFSFSKQPMITSYRIAISV